MKLFADHVAEKHVNTLMRECIASFEALMALMALTTVLTRTWLNEFFIGPNPGQISVQLCCCLISWKAKDFRFGTWELHLQKT